MLKIIFIISYYILKVDCDFTGNKFIKIDN